MTTVTRAYPTESAPEVDVPPATTNDIRSSSTPTTPLSPLTTTTTTTTTAATTSSSYSSSSSSSSSRLVETVARLADLNIPAVVIEEPVHIRSDLPQPDSSSPSSPSAPSLKSKSWGSQSRKRVAILIVLVISVTATVAFVGVTTGGQTESDPTAVSANGPSTVPSIAPSPDLSSFPPQAFTPTTTAGLSGISEVASSDSTAPSCATHLQVDFSVDGAGRPLRVGDAVNGKTRFDGVTFEAIRAEAVDGEFDDAVVVDVGGSAGKALMIDGGGSAAREGGVIVAEFDEPSIVRSVTFVGGEGTHGRVELFSEEGRVVGLTYWLTPIKGFGALRVPFPAASRATRMVVQLEGQGGIDDVVFERLCERVGERVSVAPSGSPSEPSISATTSPMGVPTFLPTL